MKDFIENSVKKIEEGVDVISSSYEKHIRKQAMEEVEQRLEIEKIKKEDITSEDYEAMINDASKEIKAKYSKRVSQGLLAIMGIDFLLG
jgi:demethoxyubiquinone hydroxylase (CLK1/Coq7/Cat5 family)